jgi:hypothetical protein
MKNKIINTAMEKRVNKRNYWNVRLLVFLICGIYNVSVKAQQDPVPLPYDRDPIRAIPRAEDHFWRKKVLSRIDLTEKVNKPLVDDQPKLYTQGADHFGNNQGLVVALINGFRDGKFIGYDPFMLHKEITFDQFIERCKNDCGMFKDTLNNPPNTDSPYTGDSSTDLGGDFDELFGKDEFKFSEDTLPPKQQLQDTMPQEKEKDITLKDQLVNFETVIELIEDWIFDKNRSAMFYNTQYIRLICIDPSGALPEKAVIAFKYQDVIEVLDDTKYWNRWNDAEHRSIREALELRRFNSYIINLSDHKPNSLPEADYRKQQIIEFEHNLWSY